MSAAGAWLATDHLAEQFTAIVQGVAEGKAPSRMLARFRPSTPFAVTERGGQTVIDPRSFARFDGIADTVTSLDAAASARAYRTLAPRLNEAYAQLGITDSTLDAALEHAIIRLVKTPVPDGDIAVVPSWRRLRVRERRPRGAVAGAEAAVENRPRQRKAHPGPAARDWPRARHPRRPAVTRRSGIALALVCLALAIRLTFALAMPNDEPDDGRMYSLFAHNIIANGVYSNDEEEPFNPTTFAFRVPAVSGAIYRVFGDGNNTAVRIVQALLDTGTCVLVALVALDVVAPSVGHRPSSARGARSARARRGLSVRRHLRHDDPHRDAGVRARHGRAPVRVDRAARWRSALALGAHRRPRGMMTMVRPESGLYLAAVGVALVIGDSPQLVTLGDCPRSPRWGKCSKTGQYWLRDFSQCWRPGRFATRCCSGRSSR